MLSKTGAIPLLARLITSRYTVLQIPALKCLAAMCFTNKYVSDLVCATRYVLSSYWAFELIGNYNVNDFHFAGLFSVMMRSQFQKY